MAVQTASDFDFIDQSISYPLPTEMEEVSAGADDDLLVMKTASLGAARGVMVAIALELAIPVCFLLGWHAWHIWR